MKQPATEKRFLFHANAVALAAHIRRSEEFFVSAVASSCLPTTGGIGMAESDGRNFREIISFESASTSVFGDFVDPRKALEYTWGNHGENTLSTVTVAEGKLSGLRISVGERIFRAGHIEARIENFSDRRSAPRFHSLSAEFSGLSVDGVGLNVKSRCDVFNRYDTKESLKRAFAGSKEFRAAHRHQFFGPQQAPSGWFGKCKPVLPESGGLVYSTVVSSLEWNGRPPKGVAIEGNRVVIDNFGSVYIGEVLIEDRARRITLLRFQLGSPQGGDVAAIDLQSNGTGWPPRDSSDDGLSGGGN